MTTIDTLPSTEARRPTPAGTRFVDVRANLMPPEVLSARQTDIVRKRVLTTLGALAALLAVAFGASWFQTHSARGDLADLNRSIAARQAEQGSFGKLAQAQADVAASRSQLSALMTGDLSWDGLIGRLRAAAPSGTTLTSVTGTTTAGAGAAAGAQPVAAPADPLNGTGRTTVGSLTLGGTASDSRSVATYSDAIAKVPGVTSVLVTGVSDGSKGVTFTMTASLTSDILGGRFTPTTVTSTTATPATTATTGGK